MGGASTGIAVEELHHIGVKNMIRIGSCGALQEGYTYGRPASDSWGCPG
ncbi:MAG: hypothetical protein ACLR0U_03795 [Enterocloster clostridioformis]